MILSCVKRIYDKLRYYVGISAVAKVLQGSKEKKLLQFGLDKLSTYGLLKTTGRTRIRAMADHLEGLGYLLTESEHQTVRLTPKASQVLYRGQTVQMQVMKEQELPACPGTVPDPTGVRQSLMTHCGSCEENWQEKPMSLLILCFPMPHCRTWQEGSQEP